MAQKRDLDYSARPVAVLAAGSNITTFALARCFQGTHIPVIALDTDGAARLLRSTKLISEVHSLDGLASDPGEALRKLRLLGRGLARGTERRPILFPTEDCGLRFCADYYRQIKEFFILLGDPTETDISHLADKGRFFSLMREDESYVPWTRACEEREQVRSLEGTIPYPVVVKPARKNLDRSFQKTFGAKLVTARSFDSLNATCDLHFPTGGVVLQGLIEHQDGDEVSWWGYRSRTGKVVGMTARQLRKHPRMGGTATLVRSEEIRELRNLAESILRKADFWGMCELEFLPQEKGYKLIECNPRPWLQIGLALRAGMNFPMLAYREVEGSFKPEESDFWNAKPQENLYWMGPEYDLIRCFFSGGKGALPKRLWTWWRDLRRADELGIWDMEEPRAVLERLLSYPGKIKRNRSLLRRRKER
jgi:predicted ATP-grasp superfamily ATP-dependent carboligase